MSELSTMTSQDEFGGAWTQRKLAVLKKYLQAYTTIFNRNARARFYAISYVDAFAGTGSLQRPEPTGFTELLPELRKLDEEFRKGSVRRALEVTPPFHKYVFIERDEAKCQELRDMSSEFPNRTVEIVNNDANKALLEWCRNLDSIREGAVVFLDRFGASVKWEAIEALGRTRAVDLWVLFPYSAINRMLVRDRKPPRAWSNASARYLAQRSGRLSSTPLLHFNRFSTQTRRSNLSISPRTIASLLNSMSSDLRMSSRPLAVRFPCTIQTVLCCSSCSSPQLTSTALRRVSRSQTRSLVKRWT